MISELSSATSELINSVLDVSMLRHKIISNNIANHNIKDYVAQDVNFESLLRAELNGKLQLDDNSKLREVVGYTTPEIIARSSENGINEKNNSLDHEMSEMAKNTLKYESLIKARGNLSEVLHMAITGSRK